MYWHTFVYYIPCDVHESYLQFKVFINRYFGKFIYSARLIRQYLKKKGTCFVRKRCFSKLNLISILLTKMLNSLN